MPELPDVTLYVERLRPRVVGQPLRAYALPKPFVLRTFEPSLDELLGREVLEVSRLGKRTVLHFDAELYLCCHLMIAGRWRWRWRALADKSPGRAVVARFEFPTGQLFLTEAGSKRRAALHVLKGREALAAFDRGGLELFDCERGSLR